MKVGCIGYSNNSGLGNYISNFRKNLPLDSQLIVRHPDKGTFSLSPFPSSYINIEATIDDLWNYVKTYKPDIVLVIETPFNDQFFQQLYDWGVKVIYVPMIDCRSLKNVAPYMQYVSAIINHTKYGHELYSKRFGSKAKYLPYPVDTDYFHPDKLSGIRDFDFIHNQGSGGAGYRKATDQVFLAFRQCMYMTTKDIKMRVNSQPHEQIHSQLFKDAKNVCVNVIDTAEPIDLYKGGKIYVAPSRREGLGLPILEAMACGLPVITTDAPPMNEWLYRKSFLVPVQDEVMLSYGDIPMYIPSAFELMETMLDLVDHPPMVDQLGKENRETAEQSFSWHVLKDKYIQLFDDVYNESSVGIETCTN